MLVTNPVHQILSTLALIASIVDEIDFVFLDTVYEIGQRRRYIGTRMVPFQISNMYH